MARARRATLTGERTTFIVADRRDFRSLLATTRAVVLTADELAPVERKFGPIFACRLPLFVLDHEQRRGYVVWDASRVGGSLKLRPADVEWVLEAVEDWISWRRSAPRASRLWTTRGSDRQPRRDRRASSACRVP